MHTQIDVGQESPGASALGIIQALNPKLKAARCFFPFLYRFTKFHSRYSTCNDRPLWPQSQSGRIRPGLEMTRDSWATTKTLENEIYYPPEARRGEYLGGEYS